MAGKGPSTSLFAKQELHASKLIILPNCFSIAFAIIGAVSIGIGYAFLEASNKVIDNGEGFRYDKVCEGKMECSIKIPLPSFADGEGDVFVYYGLKNFYQNFKEYVKNENGEIKTSQFNDTFVFEGGIPIDETGIAWPNDIKYKMADSTHGCDNPANKDVKVPKCYDCTDEKCLVWSRVAALQTFVKLYGKVDKALFKDKKELEVTIRNVYPVKEFQGEKRIYLSTMSWAGGKNPFLGTVSIGYGIVCFVLVLGVQLMAFIYPRELGDLSVLNKAK